MFGTAVQLFAGLKISAFANESLEEIVAHAKAMEYDFPVFQDVDNSLADLLGAKATADSFVIDRYGRVVYHGYIEDALNPQRSKGPALCGDRGDAGRSTGNATRNSRTGLCRPTCSRQAQLSG